VNAVRVLRETPEATAGRRSPRAIFTPPVAAVGPVGYSHSVADSVDRPSRVPTAGAYEWLCHYQCLA